MIDYPDRPVDLQALNAEIAPLGLPDFIGTARLTRRGGGSSAAYIRVKCGTLSTDQRAQLDAVVAAHVPPARSARGTGVDQRLDDIESRLAALEGRP